MYHILDAISYACNHGIQFKIVEDHSSNYYNEDKTVTYYFMYIADKADGYLATEGVSIEVFEKKRDDGGIIRSAVYRRLGYRGMFSKDYEFCKRLCKALGFGGNDWARKLCSVDWQGADLI